MRNRIAESIHLNSMDCLKKADAKMTVFIHPSNSKNVGRAILRDMSSLLFKFNEALDGVILQYDCEPPGPVAKIMPGIVPYFGVKLNANFLLFKPEVNKLLEGKVEKIGQDTINIIVLGFCSATISADDVRAEFGFVTHKGEDICISTEDNRHRIKAGTMVRFLVKSWDAETLIISGSLDPLNTGSIKWLHKNGMHGAVPLRIQKNVKQMDCVNKSENNDSPSHKLKKRKAEAV